MKKTANQKRSVTIIIKNNNNNNNKNIGVIYLKKTLTPPEI